MDKKSQFELSAVTKWIIDALRKVESVGDIITYEDLDEAAGTSVRDNRGNLTSAIKILEREDGIRFGAVRAVGLKRLDTDGVLDCGESSMKRIHNISRRSRRTLEYCINGDHLSNEQKVRLFAQRSVVGLFEHLTRRKKMKQIEAVVKHKEVELNYTEMLNAIKK